MVLGMQIGLRQFDTATVQWFKAASQSSQATRAQLARGLCEREGWRNARGELCESSARKLLPRLAERLEVALPAARHSSPCREQVQLPRVADVSVDMELADLGEVSLQPVSNAEQGRQFRALMASHHPQGEPRNPGKQLCWLVRCEHYGVIGGIGFCAASWHQQARDRHIGWTPRARAANLGLVVNNHRFLLLPGVKVANLASQVLARAVKQLPSAWEQMHGERPALVYTYVSPAHAGTSYRAAGWTEAGHTSGRSPSGASGIRRMVWVKPLAEDWQPRLGAEPKRVLGPTRRYHFQGDWAAREFGCSSHPDGRVRARIEVVGRGWEHHMGQPVPVIFPRRACQQAAYRLLSNRQVDDGDIAEGHHAATAERCYDIGTVLVPQDTTILNYTALRDATGGLAKIGGGGSGSVGIPAHVSLAMTENGRPLGVLGIEADFRAEVGEEATEKESARWLRGYGLAAELGRACPNTRVISIGDGEANIWALCAAQAADPAAGLLVRVRSDRPRQILADGQRVDLNRHMMSLKRCATVKHQIKARGGKQGRKAQVVKLELRIARVELLAPAGQSPASLPMTAVLMTEHRPEVSGEPLHWLLLCSEGLASSGWAKRIKKWYETRWSIEEYFRVLKSGTRIEDRRLNQAEDLRKCLAYDAIIAWRVFDLGRAARHQPQRAADELMPAVEIKVLYAYLRAQGIVRVRSPPGWVPDMQTFAIDSARSVGFIPSKRQPLPGNQKLWQGMSQLMVGTTFYLSVTETEQHDAD